MPELELTKEFNLKRLAAFIKFIAALTLATGSHLGAQGFDEGSFTKSEEQRIKSIEKGFSEPFISIRGKESAAPTSEPKKSEICFKIYEIELVNAETTHPSGAANATQATDPAKTAISSGNFAPSPFDKILKSTLKELKFKSGDCLSGDEILTMARAFNNKIISAGFITTSVSIPAQNISAGALLLALQPGRIGEISLEPGSKAKNQRSVFGAFGGDMGGEILNLRRIEQALENLDSASKSAATLSLSPSAKEGYSDINITKQPSFPLLLRLSADNLGSKTTGKYQGAAMLYGLNLLGLNESVFASYGRNFLKGEKERLGDDSKSGKSANYYVGFSVPFGYFNLSFWQNRYSYDQIVPASYGLYTYSGNSVRRSLELSYVYFRNQSSKNSVFFRIWQKQYKNYIQDYEINNQRKREGGYELGAKSKFFLNNASLNLNFSYLKSSGAFNALPLPEDDYDEMSSRYSLINAGLNFKTRSSRLPLSYDLEIYARRSSKHLSPIDRLNVGGYYSVRGFDGQMSLLGDSGFYVRNTVEYEYLKNSSVYVAFDIAKLSSKAKQSLGGDTLSGGGAGLKGTAFKTLSYDLFAGFAAHKPSNFKTKSPALNFILSYDF